MRYALQTFKIGGVPLRIHWSFLLVFLWLFYMVYEPGLGINTYSLLSVGSWVVIVFFIVILHELGHAWTAKALGYPVRYIIIFPLGGGAYIDHLQRDWRVETLVSIGGPAVNILLALVTAPFIWTGPPMRLDLLTFFLNPLSNVGLGTVGWLDYCIVLFFLLNLILAFFNLLPAYPLDGGRILRAMLSPRLGRRVATRFASVLGVFFAVSFLWLAWYINDWGLALGGVFVGGFAVVEWRTSRDRRTLVDFELRDVLESPPPTLSIDTPLAEIAADSNKLALDYLVVTDAWYTPVGVVDTTDITKALRRGEATDLRAITRPLTWFATADDRPEAILRKLEELNLPAVYVYDGPKPLGYVNRETLRKLHG